MQDTISKTHSFHPMKILEYKCAMKEAIGEGLRKKKKKKKKSIPTGFFRHVVVVPNGNAEEFGFQKAKTSKSQMPKGLDGVKDKYKKFDLGKFPKDMTFAAAKKHLLEQAEKAVLAETWVLSGFPL